MINTILVVDDEDFESDVLVRHLAGEYDIHAAVANETLAHSLFLEIRPELLILSFASIPLSEAFYLNLMRKHPDERPLPHQTFLFCHHKDERQAMEHCLLGVADDFIIGRPYFDAVRLRMALHMAEERFRMRGELGRCDKHLTATARDLDELARLREDSILQINTARRQGEDQHQSVLLHLNRGFRQFSQALAREYGENPRNGHLPGKLNQLNQELVMPSLERHRQAMTHPYETWAEAVEKRVGNLASSGRHDLPQPRHTIMAIDDDPVMQAYLHDLLEEAGYQVLVAGTGQEALLVLGRVHVDAILLDYQMPDMDGLAVLQHLRAMPKLADTPVLMLTVHSERHVVVESHVAGAQDFLVKPVDVALLRKKLKKYLAGCEAC